MDIFEKLTWAMFNRSGNPYVIQELVRERNLAREKNAKKSKEERTK